MVRLRHPTLWLSAAAVLISAVALVMAILALAGGPDKAACKAAIRQAYDHALTHPDAPTVAFPAACKGISQHDLEELAAQVMAGK